MAKRSIDIRTPGKLRPARLGGGYPGESSADAERPAHEEAATKIDEINVTGQWDFLYRADRPTRWAPAFRSPSCRPW
jgi:hypothetical protein